jgi:hypothetical protein
MSYFQPTSTSWWAGLLLVALGLGSWVFADQAWLASLVESVAGVAVIGLRAKLERMIPDKEL